MDSIGRPTTTPVGMADRNIDVFASRLGDSTLAIADKLSTAIELRDNVDLFCHGQSYSTFLKKLLPTLMTLLETPPVFIHNQEHKLRNCLLEIFHKFPSSHADTLKPYVAGIVDMLLNLVKTENEDNVILCMKAILDLERHHPEATAAKVQPFLDLIQDMFNSMDEVVHETFSSANGLETSSTDQETRPLTRGTRSFKVFAECPIIVVTLFQTHRSCVSPNVKKFVPLIRKVLALQAGPQERAHAEAMAQGRFLVGPSRAIGNRAAFGEFINAQVKVMSFLAYLLRVYQQQLADFLNSVPAVVVRLLRDCPSERSATRKELLVAIRHTLTFQCRSVFLSRLDDLLDERTLLGDGLTAFETLRPLAYSLLADLIHHVRDKMSRDQICKTVAVFTSHLHDSSSGTSFQTMSAKLLLNLADVIARLPDKADARHILMEILSAIAAKFANMNYQYANAVKISQRAAPSSIDICADDHLHDVPDWDSVDIFTATPIRTANSRDRSSNPIEDNKFLFKNLLTGLKGMFYQLRMCNPEDPPLDPSTLPPNWAEASHGFGAEEVVVIRKLFREGAHVFRFYSLEKPFAESTLTSPVEVLTNNYGMQSGKEEKELLETFATVFHSIDPATFHELFHADIPILYEMMFEHPALLHVPQFFLASEATSPAFAGMLLQFLMDRLPEIGQSDVKRSAILLRMFKLSFMAVTLFSQPNELVLLPHITHIITRSIQLSTTAEEPINYFYLLRSLFRSIGGGRFELLYKEILPLLEMLLEVLNNLLTSARKPQERDLYVELCLTVPARLSNLLPHLNYLMRPLVIALRAGSELVGQGLRTLELCVDNLTAEYLDPIMTPIIEELMLALWDHLKPAPYNHYHSHTTMRILGKLGGRNRRFLHKPPDLQYVPFADKGPSYTVRMVGSTRDRAFPANLGVDLAISKLWEIPKTAALKRVDPYYKKQAFDFIAAQVKLHVYSGPLTDDDAACFRPDQNKRDEKNSIRKCHFQQDVFKRLLKAVILASTLAETKDAATILLRNICQYFAAIELGRASQSATRPFDLNTGEGPLSIDSGVLVEAISECLACERPEVQEAANYCIRSMYECAPAGNLPFFSDLVHTFCSKCYEEDWFVKGGGSLGLKYLLFDYALPDELFSSRQIDLFNALIYVIKDIPLDLPASTRERAWSCIQRLLERWNVSKDDLNNKQSPAFHLCSATAGNLSHINKNVRQAAQDTFGLLATMMGTEVHEVLTPVKDRLVQAIYMKPLRALPIPIQVGYIEAISYCLALQHDLIPLDRNAERLFTEAMALADAEDAQLNPKPHEYKVAQQIVDLRVSCVRMLALVLATPEYSSQQQSQARSRIIAVFFKSLYSSSPTVIEAANVGLKSVLQQTNKLPKDLLQSGLRPILMNLQDSNKLTTQGLQGLARLLALLTNYFKTEIGERLMHHIGAIASPLVLQKASFSLIEQSPQMKIVIATFDVFHLLPSSASVFIKELIDKVVEMEKALRRTLSSPFRIPLLKYLNRFPAETCSFFADKKADVTYGRFFAQLVSHPLSQPLRLELGSSTLSMFPSEDDVVVINGIHLLHSLLVEESLESQKSLPETLFRVGKGLHHRHKSGIVRADLALAAAQASSQLSMIFVHFLRRDLTNLDLLFQLIAAMTADELAEEPDFLVFVYESIIRPANVPYWRTLMARCLDLVASRDVSYRMKTFVMRNLFNPILAQDTMRPASEEKVIDRALIEAIQDKIWQFPDMEEERSIDHTRLEILQMTAFLLKHHKAEIADNRKEIMKFGWTYIKFEDIVSRYATYVMISFFVAQFDTPFKITTQIYQALLKSFVNEGRTLVAQALDLIAPVLPERLTTEGKYPVWARWPKRVMSEDSSNLQQLVAIFQFMVRHPILFHNSRDQFVPQIITALPKIAALPTPSQEHKKLAISLLSMILDWERDGEEWDIPASLKTMLIKYLVQFINSIPERFPTAAYKLRNFQSRTPTFQLPSNEMAIKAMQLLHEFLRVWSDLEVDLLPRFSESVMLSDKMDRKEEKTITGIVNLLQVTRVILNNKPSEWVLARLGALQKVLEKVIKSENAEIQESMHAADDGKPLLLSILDVLPPQKLEEDEMDVDSGSPSFVEFLYTAASSTLESGNFIASMYIFHTLARARPEKIDSHIPSIMRALQGKLSKEQLNASGPNVARSDGLDEREMELSTRMILKTIDVISLRMSELGEQRRPFLSILASVLERSPNLRLCEKILDLVETWVFDTKHAFPTMKEKNAVLHKMLLFESRNDSTLLHRFLDLVIRIYEDPRVTRTELTVRLEHAFLIGTRATDPTIRNRFLHIFHQSLTRTASARLMYVVTGQNWDTLAETFWLQQAIQLIIGTVETDLNTELGDQDFRVVPLVVGSADETVEISTLQRFYNECGTVKVQDLLDPLCQLQHMSSTLSYEMWTTLFPICWSLLSSEERRVLEKGLVALLTRDYHQRQLDQRPNVVQALLEGATRAKPEVKIPPQVMSYLTRTFGTWYVSAASLEHKALTLPLESALVRESNLDALVNVYAGLQEDDFFYGTWRRRCKFVETNAALSYEQMGMWDKAQQFYEAAQIKARTGAVPFAQGEYMLWEDHWVLCAEKLQQWDILQDFAKHENFNDLHLESSWRTVEDWTTTENMDQLGSIVKAVSDAPTPRRTFFHAFISLLQLYENAEASSEPNHQEFNRACDESIQLSIRKWHQLPKRITNAHLPILQNFQQLVELHDANVISISLTQTTSQNLDQKSQELKLLLGTWRDRLPNLWDDINAWQDLVTWRQHIFGLINRKYLALLGPQPNTASSNSYAYRGYHETAWIINRFAHVARKHQLPEVCISQLSRIYTLPNIEIQEAFLKLREQAKCHYQNQAELTSGLDVINNTNLSYFGNQQKAEFFTLKGMFLAKLNQKDEANDAYGTALYYDIRLPKAWAEWGFYNDMKFKANPSHIHSASEAVSCYLEAAGLLKNSKSRKLLSRVLWLLSVDNVEGKIAQAFEDFKGDTPVWYWITFIPQLLTSLNHREARVARTVLLKIAMQFPQALFFLLRTVREDLLIIKKNEDQRRGKMEKATPEASQGSPIRPKEEPEGSPAKKEGSVDAAPDESLKKPWEYADEIYAKLKTMFPLLAYSMESLVDQILKHFKCPPDEDAYRLIVALLNDGFNYISRSPNAYASDAKLPQGTEANIHKFADTILPMHIRGSFEADFVTNKPTMFEYVHKLRRWRDKFEEKLDRREATQHLESYSRTLSEFKFAKFDDVEVPGQYLQHRDRNHDFIKIERIMPTVDLVRSSGFSHRRIKFRGHDGSVHPFAIQHPTARHSRREERILQLFRIFNGLLAKRKEGRRRNLNFTLPLMQPLAPSLRLIQDDASYISLQLVFEDYCRRSGINRDEPLLFTFEKLRLGVNQAQSQDSITALRMEIYTAICQKWVPQTIALDYFRAIYPSYEDFFLFRKQFSYQLAALTFMTYVMHISQRSPHKLNIARRSGNVWGSELIPALTSNAPVFAATEFVPFRLTPNLVTLMGPLACEGLFAPALMAIASCLTGFHEPGNELEQQLAVFVRDEMIFWHTQQRQPIPVEDRLRSFVQDNVDLVVKKAVSLAKPPEGTLPANQTVIDLIAKAVDPRALSATDALWMGYL